MAAPSSSPLGEASRLCGIDLRKDREFNPHSGYGARVEFTDPRTIVVTFILENPGSPIHEDPGLYGPGTFKADFFDASSGEWRGELKWPARKIGAVKLLPVHDGGFLVGLDKTLLRYSADLRLLRKREIPLDRENPESLHFDLVPGGRVGFLAFMQFFSATRETRSREEWFDVDTLETLFSSHDPYRVESPIAQDALASTETLVISMRDGVAEDHVYLLERGKEKRQLAINYVAQTFIDNDTLLLAKQKGLAVVNRQGTVLWKAKLYGELLPGLRFAKSLTGNRFVILDERRALPIIEKRSVFDWRIYAKVFDMSLRGLLVEIPLGVHDARLVRSALSPDGSRLVVVTESQAQVYSLPSVSQSQATAKREGH